jgi:hypothetical protein
VFALFADRSFLGPDTPHVALLAPFWGVNPEPPGDPTNGRFDRYAAVGTSFLRLTSLEKCDAAVFPQSWETVGDDASALERARRLQDACRAAGKPLAVFFWTDSNERVPLDAVVFRTSVERSRRLPTEFVQPVWSEDFLERYLDGRIAVRRRRPRPRVGFCGKLSDPVTRPRSLGGRARRFAGDRRRAALRRLGRLPDGHRARTRAVRALARDARIDANFVVRDDFWAGAIPGGVPDAAALNRVRREYVRNMVESDYVLCARGDGNFSYRLYETLSCGRIPVFVDTDCVLPLESAIRWRDHCVWVDERELDRIGEIVSEFHERLSDDEFEDLQRACRRLWETHLSPEGFFAHFGLHF